MFPPGSCCCTSEGLAVDSVLNHQRLEDVIPCGAWGRKCSQLGAGNVHKGEAEVAGFHPRPQSVTETAAVADGATGGCCFSLNLSSTPASSAPTRYLRSTNGVRRLCLSRVERWTSAAVRQTGEAQSNSSAAPARTLGHSCSRSGSPLLSKDAARSVGELERPHSRWFTNLGAKWRGVRGLPAEGPVATTSPATLVSNGLTCQLPVSSDA